MICRLAEKSEISSLNPLWHAYRPALTKKVQNPLETALVTHGFTFSPYYGNLSELRNRRAGVGQSIYIGQYSDTNGLSYLDARYYSPSQGQFLTQDPIFLGSPNQQNLQDPQSLNAYSYSDDNPITKSDPNGKGVFQASLALGWWIGGGTINFDFDTTHYGAQLEAGPSVGPSYGYRLSGSYDSTASLDPAGPYLNVSAGAALGGGAVYSSEAPLVWQNGNFSKTNLPPGKVSWAFGAYIGITDSTVYKSPPLYFGNSNILNLGSFNSQSTYTYNQVNHSLQQTSQQSQSSSQGSGLGGSFSGNQIQALSQLASSFGVSTLTNSQIQAAAAVKAAFSH